MVAGRIRVLPAAGPEAPQPFANLEATSVTGRYDGFILEPNG
jgi:hypothetical protein